MAFLYSGWTKLSFVATKRVPSIAADAPAKWAFLIAWPLPIPPDATTGVCFASSKTLASASYRPLLPCICPPASVPWQTDLRHYFRLAQYSLSPNSVCACATLSLARRYGPTEEQSHHLRVDQLSAYRSANPRS